MKAKLTGKYRLHYVPGGVLTSEKLVLQVEIEYPVIQMNIGPLR